MYAGILICYSVDIENRETSKQPTHTYLNIVLLLMVLLVLIIALRALLYTLHMDR